jgi:toxin-antitoxin system PIN domain toxin
MILPDVNVLIYAYNSDSAHHESAKAWWEDALRLEGPIGIPWASSLGFIRIITNRSAFVRPFPVPEALSIVRSWLRRRSVRVIGAGERHGEILFRLLEEIGTAGNLTSDAHLAALAIEYQAEIASTDSDFARFPGVRSFNPLKGTASGSRRR